MRRKIGGMRATLLGRSPKFAALRQAGTDNFDQSALTAYRQALTTLSESGEAALKDGSQPKREQQARDAYITAVAEPRLKHLRALKQEVAKEKSAARGRGAVAYFRTLEAEIGRKEAELTQALASRGNPEAKLPLALAPEWLDDTAQ